MSAINSSPHFKGLGQQMIRASEGSLQGVQPEIHELERKLEAVNGKAWAHYHQQLEELKHDQDALQEELSMMKDRGHQHPYISNTFPTNNSEEEGASYPHWAQHTKNISTDHIERSSSLMGTKGFGGHWESTQQRGSWHSWYAEGEPRGAPVTWKSAAGPGEVPSEEPPMHFPGQLLTCQRSKSEMTGSSGTSGLSMIKGEKGNS